MKHIISIILFLFSILSVSFADEIYLKDSTVVKCEIIQVTPLNIEYKTNERPFLAVPRSSVEKIVYKDGSVVQLAEITYDKIIFTDSRTIAAKVLVVDTENITYTLPGSEVKQVVKRSEVARIIYADGQKALFGGGAEEVQSEEAAVETPPYIYEKGFKDSVFGVGLLGAWGSVSGNLTDKEDDATTQYMGGVITYPIYPEGKNKRDISIDNFYYGLYLGLYLPAISVKKEAAFGLSGVKFGLISNYTRHYVEEYLYDRSLEDNNHNGKLMEYNEVRLGPEMNLILSPASNMVNLVFRFYAQGGYIHNGTLTALPGLRDAGLSLDDRQYIVDFTGYSATGGAGIRFVSNLAFPVVFGFDVQYTYSKIKFERDPEVYNNADDTSFHEIGIVVSTGVHF